ncbi:hypothetical protein [uncultured Sphaerochaeta sp.]|uniref:hypothetical protein n=1 Tax=uncultured Sphaerochaeta sp. TaxID=886478 RepID=UPI002A0A255E|nr:hypothetical protein [uncultured Sphaerochaeta sp.]
MSKRISITLFATLILLLFASCDQNTGLSYDDILGEWDFPAGIGDQDGPHISVMTGPLLDISWYDGNDSYFCYGDGNYLEGIFTGTYGYNISYADPVSSTSGSDQTITVIFSLTNNKLKAVCSGQGPLNGKTFDLGTLSDY